MSVAKSIADTVTEQLGHFVIDTRLQDLPEQAVEHAAMIIASTLASAALGRNIDSARIIRVIEVERGGRPDASVWFEAGPKLPVAGAARANALMSDAAASDDSDLRNIVHCGTPLTATALAVAEKTGASGKDVLDRRSDHPALRPSRASRLHGCDVRRHRRGGAALRARR